MKRTPLKRRTTVGKGTKTPRQIIIKKLDDLVSKIVRERDGYRCVICGTDYRPQCGHLFSRVDHATRWDIRPDGNCHCQCSGCNVLHEHDAAPYTLWFIHKFGLERYETLYAEHKSVGKWSTSELELLYEDMKARLQKKAAASGGI